MCPCWSIPRLEKIVAGMSALFYDAQRGRLRRAGDSESPARGELKTCRKIRPARRRST